MQIQFCRNSSVFGLVLYTNLSFFEETLIMSTVICCYNSHSPSLFVAYWRFWLCVTVVYELFLIFILFQVGVLMILMPLLAEKHKLNCIALHPSAYACRINSSSHIKQVSYNMCTSFLGVFMDWFGFTHRARNLN